MLNRTDVPFRTSFLLLASLCVTALGCGSETGSVVPTMPVAAVPQYSGRWLVNETITSVAGGECLQPIFESIAGDHGTGVIDITQTGSSLTARITDDRTGATCDYAGVARASAWTLSAGACTTSDVVDARCPNGPRRDVRLQRATFEASSVTDRLASGTSAHTYDIFLAGSAERVGTAEISGRFTAIRAGR